MDDKTNKNKLHRVAKKPTTSKKVKIVGSEEWLNPRTGLIENFQVIQMEDRDFNFHKIWLSAIINSLDIIGNQKTRLAFWIINNLDSNNQLIMTQRQIAKKSGISLKTVTDTLGILQDSKFLQRINVGAYRVNPDVLFKGSHGHRLSILLQYQQTDMDNRKDTDKTDKIETPAAPATAPAVARNTNRQATPEKMIAAPRQGLDSKGLKM